MTNFPRSLVLVGAGKMGGALLEGWLNGGMPGQAVSILDPYPSDAMLALCAKHGVAVNPAPGGLDQPEVLLLAVKPQMLDDAASVLAGLAGPRTLIVSVMAGKTIANMRARMPKAGALVRCIPNTPAAVGRGITVCTASPEVSDAQRALADGLLQAVGRVEWVDDEALIDAATAVSGSGPAYVFYLAECLAAAGAAVGLEPGLAARLARATVEGAGELMFQDAETTPETLRRNVTSPAGTTAAALAVLMAEDALQPLMTEAVKAARLRAEQLSG
jgi:pyrroline-5-carboxylate reductase